MATLVLNAGTQDEHSVRLDKPSVLAGSAEDADVRLEGDSVLNHHARIEHKPDGYYIINLDSLGGIRINGEVVSFQRLQHGDQIEIGDELLEFLLDDGEAPPPDATTVGELRLNAVPALRGITTSPAVRPGYHGRCPQCGMPVVPEMLACPHCGTTLTNLPAMPMDYIIPTPVGQSGPGILPAIALLAALTVIGAPIALVLGLMILSIIRRRGGTTRDRSLARWSIGLGLFWIMLGTAATVGLVQKAHRREQLNHVEVHEADAIRTLKNLACAEKYAHTIEYYDTDSDGHGEYGDLAVLAEIKSPFFNEDLADGEAFGYRFTIREVSEGQFLAVAEPVRYGETGLRTFAISKDGQIRGADAKGKRFGQIASVLPALQGERSAFYEIDDEIANDVLNYVKSLSSTPENQEKKQRILLRLRKEYSLTSVGRELEGMEATVDKFVTEQRAQAIYLEAKAALAEGQQDVALAKLSEIEAGHPSFSQIAGVERDRMDLRSAIAQRREQEAKDLFMRAEEMERQGNHPREVERLYQRIEKLYPDTDTADRIADLKPELQRQMRERDAEDLFSELMELSPKSEYDKILNLCNQLRRNYDDTAVFGKAVSALTEKERKARANSWRFKTEQNMAAGRTRGALAQLEAAADENPDLLYDLRDLCIGLYRDVADTLVEEGDARAALVYYERLDRLLQASDTDEEVDQGLLAQLHHDVGQADFERKAYREARWHLASAAWNYQEDAPFNTRFGVASLYSGLYRPAKTALTRALDVREDLVSARLYRAYLNIRLVLEFEKIIAESFGEEVNEDNTRERFTVEPEDDEDSDVDAESGEDEAKDDQEAADEKDDSETWVAWNVSSADNKRGEEPTIPEPSDIDMVLHYDHAASSEIMPDLLKFLQDLQGTLGDFQKELREAYREGPREIDAVKLGQLMTISELRNKLSELRTRHLEDIDAQKELTSMIKTMKQRASIATSDIKAAGLTQLRIQSLTETISSKINRKCAHLFEAADYIENSIESEIQMRKKVFDLAEDAVQKNASASSSENKGQNMSRAIRNLFYRKNNLAAVDQARLSLRSSMEVQVNLDDILRAAEGNVKTKGNHPE